MSVFSFVFISSNSNITTSIQYTDLICTRFMYHLALCSGMNVSHFAQMISANVVDREKYGIKQQQQQKNSNCTSFSIRTFTTLFIQNEGTFCLFLSVSTMNFNRFIWNSNILTQYWCYESCSTTNEKKRNINFLCKKKRKKNN